MNVQAALGRPRTQPHGTGAQTLGWGVALLLLLMLWRYWLVPHLDITLQVDEAQYWHWSRDLAWGYYSKPPVIAALIAASTALAGDSVLGVKWLAMLMYPLAALVLARLAYEMAGRRAAQWTLALVATAPMCGLLGLFVTTDAPLLLAWSLAAWTLWRALHRGSLWHWALFGAAVAFGMLSKYTMGAMALSVLVLLWRERASPQRFQHWRGVALALGVVLLALVPHLLWNHQHGWPTLRHTAEITAEAARPEGASRLRSWIEFSAAQLLMIGPVVSVLIGLALRRRGAPAADADTASARFFAASLALPLIAVGMLQALQSRAQINWAAPALLGAMLWLALQAPRFSARALYAAVAFNVGLAALVLHAPDLASALGRPLPHRLDAWSRMRGWDVAFERLRPAVQRLAAEQGTSVLVGENRTVIAQAAYHWRDLPLDEVEWNPGQRQDDHYQLTTRLPPPGDPAASRPMLLLAETPNASGALSGFRTAVPLGSVEAKAGERRVVRLFLWRVQGVLPWSKP